MIDYLTLSCVVFQIALLKINLFAKFNWTIIETVCSINRDQKESAEIEGGRQFTENKTTDKVLLPLSILRSINLSYCGNNEHISFWRKCSIEIGKRQRHREETESDGQAYNNRWKENGRFCWKIKTIRWQTSLAHLNTVDANENKVQTIGGRRESSPITDVFDEPACCTAVKISDTKFVEKMTTETHSVHMEGTQIDRNHSANTLSSSPVEAMTAVNPKTEINIGMPVNVKPRGHIFYSKNFMKALCDEAARKNRPKMFNQNRITAVTSKKRWEWWQSLLQSLKSQLIIFMGNQKRPLKVKWSAWRK